MLSEYIFDGALCMELLVDWRPQYGNVEAMLVQISAFLSMSGARIASVAGSAFFDGAPQGEQLVDAGHNVVGVRRRSEQLPESFTRISADIASRDGWKNVPKQIDRWVYALAADDRSTEAYERAYETGTQRLVEHLGGETSGRVIFVSSTSVYEYEDGRATRDVMWHARARRAARGDPGND